MDLSQNELLILSLGSFFFGVYLLIKGGDWTVDSACVIARRFGLSPALIGFTVVAFGTSLPEMVVTVNAHLKDMTDIAMGGVVGSNISNVLLIIGASALITPLLSNLNHIRDDMIMMGFASVLLAGLLRMDVLSQWVGVVMLGLLILYTAIRIIHTRKDPDAGQDLPDIPEQAVLKTGLVLVCGLIFLAMGAEFLVRGAGTAARMMGVPELVIGLTLVAFGTSAPELAACIAAAMKKQPGMVVGNILGSNVFNILSILGVTILVKPMAVGSLSPALMDRDIMIMLASSFALIAVLVVFKTVPRWAGFGFVGCYAAYIAALGFSL